MLLARDAHLTAFFLYIAAILTDLVDGWLAKRLGAVSEFGKFLDPASDKLLAGSTWIALLLAGWAPPWLAFGMLGRDAIVALAWLAARAHGVRFEPNLPGRLMVSFEGVALPLLLLHVEWLGVHWASAGVILGVVTLVLAAVSAGQYAVWGLRAARLRRGIPHPGEPERRTP